jgi:hypothetical protein
VLRKGWKTKRKLNRSEFSKKCKVSEASISKAVKRGEVVEGEDGFIDITNPLNRAYLQADHSVKAHTRRPKGEKEARAAETKRRAKLNEQKTIEQTRQYSESANWAVQRRAKDLGLLVLRSSYEQKIAAYGQELKMRILGLPRQISSDLFALAHTKSATPMALEGLLLERLSDALTHCKEKARALKIGS